MAILGNLVSLHVLLRGEIRMVHWRVVLLVLRRLGMGRVLRRLKRGKLLGYLLWVSRVAIIMTNLGFISSMTFVWNLVGNLLLIEVLGWPAVGLMLTCRLATAVAVGHLCRMIARRWLLLSTHVGFLLSAKDILGLLRDHSVRINVVFLFPLFWL